MITRYRLGLIVYDIAAVKIFDRYRNIALSIRDLDASSMSELVHGQNCNDHRSTPYLVTTRPGSDLTF